MDIKMRFLIFSALFLGILGLLTTSIRFRGAENSRAQRQIESDLEEAGALLVLENHYEDVRSQLTAVGVGDANDTAERQSITSIRELLTELQDYVQSDEVEDDGSQAEMQALTQLVEQTDTLEQLLTANETEKAKALTEESLERIFREIHTSIELFRKGAFEEIRDAVARLNSEQHALQSQTLNGAIVLVILLGVAWVGFSYGILRQVRNLTLMTRRLSNIDFNVEEQPIPKGELGELTLNFITMANALGSFTQEMETRVKERTQELEASRSLLKLMLDTLPDAVGLRRSNDDLLACNGRYRELISDAAGGLTELRGKERTPQGYYIWNRADGGTRLLDLQTSSARVSPDGEGHVQLEYIRDVTRLTEVEAALAQSQRLISLGRLAAGIAHEVNSPLTAIGACAEGLLDRSQAGASDANETHEYLQIIHQEVYRCKALTERLLDLSCQRQESAEPTSVSAVVAEALKLLAYLNKSRKIEIDFPKDLESEQALAFARPAALRQICINLLMNANHASDPGSRIEVRVRTTAHHVTLEVRDHGVGVAEEDMGRLFEPFFTKRRSKDGTGLGLFLCREMASAMGGSLTAQSDGAGLGACFELTLPKYTPTQDQGDTI